MIKHYCDKCGEEIRGSRYTMDIAKDDGKPFRHMELCDSCHSGVNAWMNGLAENEIPDVVAHGGWIPVSERLPEYGERVLTTDGSCVRISFYAYSTWGRPTTAWMPLPEAYKEER